MKELSLEAIEGMFEAMKKCLEGMICAPLGWIACYPQGGLRVPPRGDRLLPPGGIACYPQGE